MIIRTEQMKVFEVAAMDTFKKRLLDHIQACFPSEHEAIGEKFIVPLIDSGTRAAQRYGFSSERDICTYVDLMMIFGPNFDKNTDLAWAGALLNDREILVETRMQSLLAAACRTLKLMAV